jgi:hypothetical protein
MLATLRPSLDFGRPRDGVPALKRDLARLHPLSRRNMVMPPPLRAEYPPDSEIEDFAEPGGLRLTS